MLPHEDPQPRYLRPVSTAATLNFAATLAQSARLWKDYDPTFAADCLEKAEIAWQAALTGGGPYNDDYVGDEFYWAACELYVTTGKDEYKNYLMNSPHYLEMPAKMGENGGANGEDNGLWGCFTLGTTQGLGTITLALVENGLLKLLTDGLRILKSKVTDCRSNRRRMREAVIHGVQTPSF